jgi:hypothetical protein
MGRFWSRHRSKNIKSKWVIAIDKGRWTLAAVSLHQYSLSSKSFFRRSWPRGLKWARASATVVDLSEARRALTLWVN